MVSVYAIYLAGSLARVLRWWRWVLPALKRKRWTLRLFGDKTLGWQLQTDVSSVSPSLVGVILHSRIDLIWFVLMWFTDHIPTSVTDRLPTALPTTYRPDKLVHYYQLPVLHPFQAIKVLILKSKDLQYEVIEEGKVGSIIPSTPPPPPPSPPLPAASPQSSPSTPTPTLPSHLNFTKSA